jgi:hypothetical protein
VSKDRLIQAIAKVFGKDASLIPAQTIANAPVVLLMTAEQLTQLTGFARGTVLGYTEAFPTFGGDTPNGVMYILAGQSRMDSFRSYGHELGNLLDRHYFGSASAHRDPNITSDWDTGAAFEEALFGPPH